MAGADRAVSVSDGVARAAADTLVGRKDELAKAITARLYAAMPELDAKYGERGRAKCLEDMRYNIEHLAPAVALRSPAMFAGYAQWLGELLQARGIPTTETVLSLELTLDVLDEALATADAAAARPCVEAGLTALLGRTGA
jgi:MerR family transcriptional regulator, light-induced transcriptional regulator